MSEEIYKDGPERGHIKARPANDSMMVRVAVGLAFAIMGMNHRPL